MLPGRSLANVKLVCISTVTSAVDSHSQWGNIIYSSESCVSVIISRDILQIVGTVSDMADEVTHLDEAVNVNLFGEFVCVLMMLIVNVAVGLTIGKGELGGPLKEGIRNWVKVLAGTEEHLAAENVEPESGTACSDNESSDIA